VRTYDPDEVEQQLRRIAAGCFLELDMKAVERDTSDVHWVNAVIPAPQSFRDMDASLKRGHVVYFGSPMAIATYSVVLYALSGAAFANFWRSIRYRRSTSLSRSLGRRGRSRALTASRCKLIRTTAYRIRTLSAWRISQKTTRGV
jgi:hypothetical protein